MRTSIIINEKNRNVVDYEQLYLFQYREAIKRGEIVAGQELITELDRLIDDLINSDEFYYDTTAADIRIDFMENCIRLTKSPFYGKPMILMLWQKAFIETIYSFKMASDSTDRFQRIVLLIARKNTKSEFTSAILLTEMVLGGKGLDIVCSSNDDNQAGILYEAIDTMRLMIDPEQVDTWRNQKWIRNKVMDNKIFKLSDRTRNKEGRNIDIAGIDEVHEMKDNVIIKSIEQSQSLKENPKLIMITTEGFVNDGFLDKELIRDRAIINGEISDIASKRVTAWLYTQDSETEIWNGSRENRLWQKSNPSVGIVKKWSYLEQQVDIAKSSKADRAFVLAKDFNLKQSNSEAWLMLEDYNYESSFDLNDFRGCLCLGGVDIAETTDLSTAWILLMKPNDPKKYVHKRYFIPEGKLDRSDDRTAGAKYIEWANQGKLKVLPGNYIDVTLIADWFFSLYEEYGLRPYICGYDIRFATDFLKKMDMYGFETEMVYQRPEVLNQAIKMVEADLKSQLIIGLNEVDKWCLGNAALKIDGQGNGLIVKIDGQVSRKIDGAVALVILYEIFRRHRSDFLDNVI